MNRQVTASTCCYCGVGCGVLIEHDGAQVFAWHVVHHEVVAFFDGEEIGDLGQVVVIEARQDGGLAQELVAGLL